MASQQSWTARSSALADAVQGLLEAAVSAASTDGVSTEAENLNAATAKFDSIAAALEADLTALAETHALQAPSMPTQLLRELAARESQSAPPIKKPRR